MTNDELLKRINHEKDTTKKVLSAMIRGARMRKKMTQNEVAEATGLTPRTICMLESEQGANCGLDTLLSVAILLDLKIVMESTKKPERVSSDSNLRIPKRVTRSEEPVVEAGSAPSM